MENIKKIQFLFILLGLSIILISYLIYKVKIEIEEKRRYTIFSMKDQGKGERIYRLYDFFSQWIFTKRYLKRLYRQYEIIMPKDIKSIEKKTIETALFIFSVDLVIGVFVFALRFSTYVSILAITYILIINEIILHYVLESNKIKLLYQFEKWISDVRHNYQVHERVDEAIYETIEKTEYPFKLHANQIYLILDSNDPEREADAYNETVPNRFIKTFLALSIMIEKLGDKKIDDQSVFLTNLRYLKQETEIELLKMEKLKYLFSGLIFVAITPLLFLKAIQNWGISAFSELESYYLSAVGIITLALIFVSTIIAYNIINRLKEVEEMEVKSYVILEALESVPFIKRILDNIHYRNYGESVELEKELKRVGESITVSQFILKRIIYSVATFSLCIALSFVIRNNKIQKEYFKWYELLLTIGISVLAYKAPYLVLLFMKKIRQMHMEDEVIQFHSIILMLMYIDGMSIETILEWLETFAVVFKTSIQDCINNLEYGELEALEELARNEPFEPFVRIIKNLQACDRIEIHKAFDEIAVDRLNYQEKRKFENEKFIKNKSEIGKYVAWTPFALTIGLYLIVPFVVEGISQLLNSLSQINTAF